MTIYNWLTLFGVPTISIGAMGCIWMKLKKSLFETKALKLGIQAILRDRLYQLYNYCNGKGFADINERNNFNNLYQQYHTLGANGVMDDIHKKFLGLPTERGVNK